MSRLRDMQILFDGNVNVFSQGDVIRGQVILQVDTRDQKGLTDVQGIWVQFRAKAKTHWTTRERHGNSTRTHNHTLKELYFDTVIVVFGTGKYQRAIKDLTVPPGTHGYPFAFQLPPAPLPAPFEGKYGYVRYKAKATVLLIRTFANKSLKAEKLFSMIGPTVDLNLITQAQLATNSTKEFFNCCGCGSTVEASISVGLPKQGFVPGESIYVIGNIDNRDRDEQHEFDAMLVQKISYHSRGNRKEIDTVLGMVRSRVGCPRGRVTNFSIGPLLIPPVPPTGLPGCNIIDITYRVKCHGDGNKFTFPVVIGTIPLRIPSPAVTASAPPQYPAEGNVPSAPASYDEPPPPSYEAAVGMIDRLVSERSREDYFNDGQFVPSYPYFNLSVDIPPDSR